jgi:hypothetical protein
MPSQENSCVMWCFKLNMSKWGLYSMNNKDNR